MDLILKKKYEQQSIVLFMQHFCYGDILPLFCNDIYV